MGEKDASSNEAVAWRDMGQYAGLGLQFALAIGLFLWLGWKLDAWLGTTPLLTIVGAFVGGAAAFYSIYRRLVLDARTREAGAPGSGDGTE
jgi:F0F1-type ATP synthase assembly protein I